MNTTKASLVALALCMSLATAAFANDAHHPEKAQGGKAAPAVEAKVADAPQNSAVNTLQSNVAKMQTQVRRIAKAKSDEERARVVDEHMHTLHQSMMAAKGMHDDMEGCSMMDGMMGSKSGMGGMSAGAKSAASADERMERMEKRMDMMEQMMKHSSGEGMPGMDKH